MSGEALSSRKFEGLEGVFGQLVKRVNPEDIMLSARIQKEGGIEVSFLKPKHKNTQGFTTGVPGLLIDVDYWNQQAQLNSNPLDQTTLLGMISGLYGDDISKELYIDDFFLNREEKEHLQTIFTHPSIQKLNVKRVVGETGMDIAEVMQAEGVL